MIKWVLAVLGFLYGRFGGAIAGFFLGSILDRIFGSVNAGRSSSKGDFGRYFESRKTQVSPKDFELNLLSLCSVIIKADGRVNQRELDYVRSYFVQAYGKERANATFKTFNEVIKHRSIDLVRICAYIRARTRYEVRLQILHFLFGITQADGHISAAEIYQLKRIASHFQLTQNDFESIKAMFVNTHDSSSAYKILEIDKSASDAEVKKAFRTMAKKYHPDKLVGMDEAYKKGAQEKFMRVQQAYEQIQKERGL
ncbi:TerB family tellurite resistance protein [uncultured Mesonia sp.]|uniref:TerB family tellurite resistance protein n=1 Tax=uncultured Mesonia sp. TaxID=399731 RepID=UPI00374F15CC